MPYTVVRGDTLVRIGRRFRTSGRSIAYWNRATYPSLDPESTSYRPDVLQVGWVLQIMPGQEYVPPPDDGESGEKVTPTPSDDEESGDAASAEPSPSGSASPSPEASAGG
jgi:LysM repeat protein